MTMNRIALSMLGAALVLGAPAAGFTGENQPAPASPNDTEQMSDEQIRDQLSQDGYSVEELKHEGGDRISVIATDDRSFTSRLIVDARSGRATPVSDDDNDDD